MVTECPKCQTMQTVDFNQLLEETDIVCVGCQSILKLKIVAEVVDTPDDDALEEGFSTTSEAQPPSVSGIEALPKQEIVIKVLPEEGPEEAIPDSSPAPLQASYDEEMQTDYPEERAEDRQKILLCIDGEASRELIQELLAETNYRVIDVPSGIAAFMSMKLERPDVALIDAGLTDMPGADLCAQIKAHADLKDTAIILVGSMFEKNTRYRRQPPPMCGADDYIDRYHLQSELIPMIQSLLNLGQEVPSPEQEVPSATPELALAPVSETAGETSSELAEEASPAPQAQAEPEAIEKAERLARTIFSDIALYNVEKIEEGIRGDCLEEALKAEILEGRKLFEARVSSAIVASGCFEKTLEDFIQREKMKWATQEPAAAKPSATLEPFHEPEALIPTPHAPPSTEKPEAEMDRGDIDQVDPEELESAKRLARIIVSDIAIYNEKKVDEGLKAGTFYSLLSAEISEGRKLFEARVSEMLPNRLEYFKEALEGFVKRRQEANASAPERAADSNPELEEARTEAPPEERSGLNFDPALQVDHVLQHKDPFAEKEAFTQEEPSKIPPVEVAEKAFMMEEDPKAHENAKRLARIILSDIVIYNERKVDLGIRSGRFFEVLREEISEGRRLYASRVSEKIVREKNYFQEACNAFISKRSATAA